MGLARAIALLGVATFLHLASADDPAANAGDAAKTFASKAAARLRLLSGAAQQVLATPGVEKEPVFSKSLHKVSSQLQESANILQKWGADYARNADANDMAVTLAEQGAAFEVRDLKRQLRAAIEADQENQIEQPKRLADVSQKVANLRSELDHLVIEEAKETKQKAGTALISDVWPRPPKNATKAEIGLFMHRRKLLVHSGQQDEEDKTHLEELESKLGSLETQLAEARNSVVESHAAVEEAHAETQMAESSK